MQGCLVTLDLPFQIHEQIWKDCRDCSDLLFKSSPGWHKLHEVGCLCLCSLFNVLVFYYPSKSFSGYWHSSMTGAEHIEHTLLQSCWAFRTLHPLKYKHLKTKNLNAGDICRYLQMSPALKFFLQSLQCAWLVAQCTSYLLNAPCPNVQESSQITLASVTSS